MENQALSRANGKTPKTPKKAPRVQTGSPQTPPQPRYVMRGDRTFIHSVFKLTGARCMKRISWQEKLDDVVSVDHGHIFHSHNKRGQENQYTSWQSGHCHKVTQSLDENGNPIIEVGPPLKKVLKRFRDGTAEKRLAPVEFENEKGGPDGRTRWEDTHTHKFEYIGSEELSQNKIENLQKETRAQVQAMGVNPNPTPQPAAVEGFSESDGAGTVE